MKWKMKYQHFREIGWNRRGLLRCHQGEILANEDKINASGLNSRLTCCRRSEAVSWHVTSRGEIFGSVRRSRENQTDF